MPPAVRERSQACVVEAGQFDGRHFDCGSGGVESCSRRAIGCRVAGHAWTPPSDQRCYSFVPVARRSSAAWATRAAMPASAALPYERGS